MRVVLYFVITLFGSIGLNGVYVRCDYDLGNW